MTHEENLNDLELSEYSKQPKKTKHYKSRTIITYLTQRAIHQSLNFRLPQKLALISGAGIAGLAASFELLARGYKVIIAEKRRSFDRFNIINLDVEVKRFLDKFGLLEEFENRVAARISHHQYLHFKEEETEDLGLTNVSSVQSSDLPFDPQYFPKLFREEGVYSVSIKDLQTFLANRSQEGGAFLLGDTEVLIEEERNEDYLNEVNLARNEGYSAPRSLSPDLFLIAEGAHSKSAESIALNKQEIINECTGEQWIYGNVPYKGSETFVISVIDTRSGELQIANLIFNAAIHEINIALSVNHSIDEEQIRVQLLSLVQSVLAEIKLDECPEDLLNVVSQPVVIHNEKREQYSKRNAFCLGDASGHSSPLAGMGGTLGLTLFPRLTEKLIDDYEQEAEGLHENYHHFSDAAVSRWMDKSVYVKKFIQGKASPCFFSSSLVDVERDEPTIRELTQISRV